jgi:hypothetical protein
MPPTLGTRVSAQLVVFVTKIFLSCSLHVHGGQYIGAYDVFGQVVVKV